MERGLAGDCVLPAPYRPSVASAARHTQHRLHARVPQIAVVREGKNFAVIRSGKLEDHRDADFMLFVMKFLPKLHRLGWVPLKIVFVRSQSLHTTTLGHNNTRGEAHSSTFF
jgi:hypothetical protein